MSYQRGPGTCCGCFAIAQAMGLPVRHQSVPKLRPHCGRQPPFLGGLLPVLLGTPPAETPADADSSGGRSEQGGGGSSSAQARDSLAPHPPTSPLRPSSRVPWRLMAGRSQWSGCGLGPMRSGTKVLLINLTRVISLYESPECFTPYEPTHDNILIHILDTAGSRRVARHRCSRHDLMCSPR